MYSGLISAIHGEFCQVEFVYSRLDLINIGLQSVLGLCGSFSASTSSTGKGNKCKDAHPAC